MTFSFGKYSWSRGKRAGTCAVAQEATDRILMASDFVPLFRKRSRRRRNRSESRRSPRIRSRSWRQAITQLCRLSWDLAYDSLALVSSPTSTMKNTQSSEHIESLTAGRNDATFSERFTLFLAEPI